MTAIELEVQVAPPTFTVVSVLPTGPRGPAGPQGPEGPEGPPGGEGSTDHGELDGLADDDHPQYHNDARGDARYWPLTTDLATQLELNAEATLARNADNLTSGTVNDARLPAGIARDAEVASLITAEEVARDAAIATAIGNLIASAPGLLDTLDEIAAALGDDPNFATTITTALAGKQTSHANLTALAGLAGLADRLPYFTGAGAMSMATFTAFARSILDDADDVAARATLGLVLGTDIYSKAAVDGLISGLSGTYAALAGAAFAGDVSVPDEAYGAGWNTSLEVPTKNAVYDQMEALDAGKQDADGDLTDISALSPANDDVIQRKAGAWTNRTMAQLIADLAALGTTFQTLNTDLTAIAALTSAANKVPYATGSGTWALADFTAAGRSMAAAADAAAQAALLGSEVFKQAQAVNAQTGTTYTLAASDAGKLVTLSNGSAITLTVPQDSDATIAVGTYVDLYQLGAGQVTVAAGTGATLRTSGLTAKARAQYARLGLQKVSANTWSLFGDLAAS